jgi:hypothetical protein
MPLRWGPAREPGEIKVATSTVAILKTFFTKPAENGHGSGKT